MTFSLLFIVVVGIVLWRGGRLTNLRDISVNHVWLLFIPITVHLLVFSSLASDFNLSDDVVRFVYVASMAIVAVAVWLNRRLPGMGLITIGFVLNFAVISLNGGLMPASNAAHELGGYAIHNGRFQNSMPITNTTLLPWLGDVLPLPNMPPIRGVYSIGDIFIYVGGMIFIYRALKPLPKKQSSDQASST